MENVDELYEYRMGICKKCPLYTEGPMGSRCNNKLYISLQDKKTISDRPKVGYVRGCSCLLEKRNRLPNAKCVCGKW